MSDFSIVRNDTPKVSDTLKEDGVVVNLTGATVLFNFQGAGVTYSRAATVVSALAGTVEYQCVAQDTELVGLYEAQWQVTIGSQIRTFPSGAMITFDITEEVPTVATAGTTLLRDNYDLVRAILGDTNPAHRRYQDEAIAQVLRAVLRLGRVPGYALAPDARSITPVITEARPLGLLAYHAAKLFLVPNMAAYSYRTRAMSESFGEQKHFLFDLENAIYDLENVGGVFATFQSFYGWVNATTGADLWQRMTELKTNAPVATATVGRDGLTVSSN